ERKSIEPMAARLDSQNVQPVRQSLHHLVAKAPWKDETLLDEVRHHVLPAMQKQGPVVGWIVDDTGFPKKGKHSVGVTRQYCGQGQHRPWRRLGRRGLRYQHRVSRRSYRTRRAICSGRAKLDDGLGTR